MRKTILLSIFILSMAIMPFSDQLQAADGKPLAMPETAITIEGKKPATFDHAKHADLGLTCGVCHHNGDHQPLAPEEIAAKTSGEELRCVSCHNSSFPVKNLQEPKDIFHSRCKDCHSKGVDGRKGPTQCGACHVKAKKSVKKLEGC
jgi:hypothetical protein